MKYTSIAVLIAGVSSAFLPSAGIAGDTETVRVTPPNLDEPAAPIVKRFALMSLFAKTAYRKDIADEAERKKNGCNYLSNPPKDLPGTLRWKRLDRNGACYNSGGLFFETYVHDNGQGEFDKAVIAFRGTEFKTYADWKANLSGIIPSRKNEYIAAKEAAIPLIQVLKNSGAKEIYLTGHSLGGGLAQEIAYLSADVTATYTFNTSPVTGWMKQKFEGGVVVDNPIIHRVYMSKEVLSYIRKITSHFNYKLPNRTDYMFNYLNTKDPLKAHEMSELTCNFARRVTEGADFDYSHADAAAVLKNASICSI